MDKPRRVGFICTVHVVFPVARTLSSRLARSESLMEKSLKWGNCRRHHTMKPVRREVSPDVAAEILDHELLWIIGGADKREDLQEWFLTQEMASSESKHRSERAM